MAPSKVVLAFDAYGTLLSTQSISEKLASHFGKEKAETIAATWRKYQLEYTWRANSMGIYFSFSEMTRRSLRHSLAESGVSLDENQTEEMMKAYDSLSAFPDVKPALDKLKAISDMRAVVFSNGTHQMVSSSVNNSPGLSPYSTVFDDIVVVEPVRKFKPSPEAYHHLARTLGKNGDDNKEMESIWLVSGNPFDVEGARNVGMNAVWIDRAGNGWQDALIPGQNHGPSKIARGLDEAVDIVAKTAMSTSRL